MSFDEMGLSLELVKGLADINMEEPTPLQKKVVPAALQGKHILVKDEAADDGVLLIPVLQRLAMNGEVSGTRILILTPSAERAKKLDELIWAVGYHAQISSVSISLKGNKKDQEKAISEGAPLLVANPGQLSDILAKSGICFENLAAVVIDQADMMNEHNLVNRIKNIVSSTSGKPQVMIMCGSINDAVQELHDMLLKTPKYFGAKKADFAVSKSAENGTKSSVSKKTASPADKDAAETDLKNAAEDTAAELAQATPPVMAAEEKLKEAGVKVVLKKDLETAPQESKETPHAAGKGPEQAYINVPPRMKISTLVAHLEKTLRENAVVFTASKQTSDRLFRIILKKNWGVVSIHEGIADNVMKERFAKFAGGDMKVLIAGGISVKDLNLENIQQVINYDVPEELDEYKLRAALVRNGKAAQMISLVSGMDKDDIDRIVKEAGYSLVEIELPVGIADKKNRKKQSGKKAEASKYKKHAEPKGKESRSKKEKKTKKTLSREELPRPSYEKLSGGRSGGKSGGIIGWVKRLFG